MLSLLVYTALRCIKITGLPLGRLKSWLHQKEKDPKNPKKIIPFVNWLKQFFMLYNQFCKFVPRCRKFFWIGPITIFLFWFQDDDDGHGMNSLRRTGNKESPVWEKKKQDKNINKTKTSFWSWVLQTFKQKRKHS